MDFKSLSYFVQAAETLNFTQAAKTCGISQTAISLSIAKMEKELGFQLFERTNRSMRLTPAGRDFFVWARQTMDVYSCQSHNRPERRRKYPMDEKKIVTGKRWAVLLVIFIGCVVGSFSQFVTSAFGGYLMNDLGLSTSQFGAITMCPMTLLVTAVWGGMVLVSNILEKRAVGSSGAQPSIN